MLYVLLFLVALNVLVLAEMEAPFMGVRSNTPMWQKLTAMGTLGLLCWGCYAVAS